MLELQKGNNRKCNGGGAKPLVALALLFALAVPVVAADDWVYIGGSNGDEFYLNRRSIEKQRDYVTGWVRTELGAAFRSEPAMRALAYVYGREPSYHMTLWAAKKGSRQIRLFQTTFYDRNGNPIPFPSQSGSGEWQYCIPNTVQEAVWEALMDAAGIRY